MVYAAHLPILLVDRAVPVDPTREVVVKLVQAVRSQGLFEVEAPGFGRLLKVVYSYLEFPYDNLGEYKVKDLVYEDRAHPQIEGIRHGDCGVNQLLIWVLTQLIDYLIGSIRVTYSVDALELRLVFPDVL